MSRLKSRYGRRCVRCYFRHQGRIIRMLHTHDYRPCEWGGDPIFLVKLLDHRRYAAGIRLADPKKWWAEQVLPHLLPGQWVELEFTWSAS